MRDEFPMGTVSNGTMRPEDLIPRFLDELKFQLRRGPSQSRETRKIHFRILNDRKTDPGYWDSEEPMHDLEALTDALDCYAGPYMYFGSHPGNGSDYGFWLSEEWEEQLDNDGGIRVSDLSEVPPDHFGYVAVVTDHGNVTLYNRKRNHRLYEVWSIV